MKSNRLIVCFNDIKSLINLFKVSDYLYNYTIGEYKGLKSITRLYKLNSEIFRLKRLETPFPKIPFFSDFHGINEPMKGWDSLMAYIDKFYENNTALFKGDFERQVSYEDYLYNWVGHDFQESEKKLLRTFLFDCGDDSVTASNLFDTFKKYEKTSVKYVQYDNENDLCTNPDTNELSAYNQKLWGFKMIKLLAGFQKIKSKNIALKQTIVSVIDTGIDYEHTDIKGNMWNGNNMYGINYTNRQNKPMDYEYNSHGTHIAGVVAAMFGNGGIFGISPNVKVIALKPFLDNYGKAFDSDCAQAIRDSFNFGARVINISWGRTLDNGEINRVIDDVILEVVENGDKKENVTIICAAYNLDRDIVDFSPANNSRVICVSSINENDQKADSCGFGSGVIYAPGVNIFSLKRANGNRYNTGTSMATPHVTGLVSLILSINPKLTPNQIKNIIVNKAVQKSFGKRIDAEASIKAAILTLP